MRGDVQRGSCILSFISFSKLLANSLSLSISHSVRLAPFRLSFRQLSFTRVPHPGRSVCYYSVVWVRRVGVFSPHSPLSASRIVQLCCFFPSNLYIKDTVTAVSGTDGRSHRFSAVSGVNFKTPAGYQHWVWWCRVWEAKIKSKAVGHNRHCVGVCG